MRYLRFKDKFLIKLEKNEEVISTLTNICKQEKIILATFSGIGAFSSATIGYFELSTKTYHWEEFDGDLEVCSINGNVAMLKGEPFIHAHATIADEEQNAFGGHLKHGIVSITLEVTLGVLEGEVERKLEKQTGLNLLDL